MEDVSGEVDFFKEEADEEGDSKDESPSWLSEREVGGSFSLRVRLVSSCRWSRRICSLSSGEE